MLAVFVETESQATSEENLPAQWNRTTDMRIFIIREQLYQRNLYSIPAARLYSFVLRRRFTRYSVTA